MSVGRYLGTRHNITGGRKDNPYPKGLKISTETKQSVSGSDCHSILNVEGKNFFNFPSLNFLPQKANYKRPRNGIHLLSSGMKKGKPSKDIEYHERATKKRGENENKGKQLVPRLHRASKVRAEKGKINFM